MMFSVGIFLLLQGILPNTYGISLLKVFADRYRQKLQGSDR